MKKTFRKIKSKSKTQKNKSKFIKILHSGGGGEGIVFHFNSDKISLQPNIDPNFKEIGIIHLTTSSAVNFIRNDVTNFVNAFGFRGFDNTIFDTARNDALSNLNSVLQPNQKVSNLRMEIDTRENLFFVHIYGNLLEKIQSS